MRKLALAISLLLACPLLGQVAAPAPVWVTITPEDTNIAVTLPAGATYRFGDTINDKWSDPVTVAAVTTISPVSMSGGNPFPFADPDYGTVKELDVLEAAAPQTITVSDLSLSPPAPVTRIIPGLAPPTSVDATPGSQHTVTLTKFVNNATTSNAIAFELVNEPPDLGNRGWQGTGFEMDIDGVAFDCTFGQTYTDDVFTLTCTVPATP
jgi:hypothetical protein